MKVGSLFSFMVGLAVFSTALLPAKADYDRYPTTREIKKLMPEFRKQIESIRSYGLVRNRSYTRSFAAAWSRVDRAISPFLGTWVTSSAVMVIYPSKVRGRVCIISPGVGQDSSVEFTLGTVNNGQIWTDSRHIFVKQDDFLGVIGIYNQRPDIFALRLIEPVQVPNSLLDNYPQGSRIIKQFNAAGCTASLPNRR